MSNIPGYDRYAQIRGEVAEFLEALREIFVKLDAAKRAASLATTRDSLLSDAFRVLILGEFSRGKSTLINAMLGEPVLPAKISPCTAVITRLAYGDRKAAVLHSRDGQPERIDLVAMPDELKRRITIQEEGKHPIDFCEVFYPLALLRNNVELVDSPGLNESETRTEITRSFFEQADVMLLVLNCEMAFSESERSFLDTELRDRDLRDVFFLWNRYDAVRDSPEDLADVKKRSRDKLEPRLGGRPRVFYVSARDALKGRVLKETRLVEQSNFLPFEAALEEFLTSERGRVKLRGPLRVAGNAIKEGLEQLIPQREGLLNQPLDELKRIFAEQKPRLDAAQRQQERILQLVERRGETMKREARSLVRALMVELETGLQQRGQEMQVGMWEALTSQNAARERIAAQLSAWVTQQGQAWQQQQLSPTIERNFSDLEAELNDEVGEFLGQLDRVQLEFNANLAGAESAGASHTEVSALSRLAGVGFGLLTQDIGAAVEGASIGVGSALRSFGVKVAAVVGLLVLAAPLSVIGFTVLGISGVSTFLGTKKIASQIREQTIGHLAQALRNQQPTIEQDAESKIVGAIEAIRSLLSQKLSIRIDEVRGQVEAIVQEREAKESAAAEQLANLADARQRLTELAAALERMRREYLLEE